MLTTTATFKHTPIHYLYRSIPPERLAALYAAADVLVISSIRDGLNLVSYEYVACQAENNGVLMMSSYTGAMKTLPADSMIMLNPWDTPRFAERINQALSMGREEKQQRYLEIVKVVDDWTSAKWGRIFLETLIKGDVPKNSGMPDKDPMEVGQSDVPDSETGGITD